MGITSSPGRGPTEAPSSARVSPPTGAQGAGTIEVAEDLDDGDSAIDAGSLSSSTASLSESIFEYRRLHGRTYQSTGTTEYWAPNDEQQNDGLDLIHHGLLKLLGDKLYLAPIGKESQKILDLGTGTGIWAIDFGDQFPDAEVTGTDISPIQPAWVSPNVKFVIDDFLLDWTWPDDHFDFVHLRSLYGVVPDLAPLYAKSFRCTKPGGWIEHLEMDVKIESDHIDFPETHIFNRWADLVYEAGNKIGRSFGLAQGHTMKENLEQAGFIDVAEKKVKVPLHSWPKDPQMSEAGKYFQTAFDESLEGFGTFLFTQVLGLGREEVLVLAAEMRKEARKRSNLHWFLL
ncbi:hypothetical protein ACHAQH_005674 [Verticillium albo-atrum]